MNTAFLASPRQTEINRQLADICLRPPVDKFAAFDHKPFDQIVEIGYRYAQQSIAAAQATTMQLQPNESGFHLDVQCSEYRLQSISAKLRDK